MNICEIELKGEEMICLPGIKIFPPFKVKSLNALSIQISKVKETM